MRFIIIQTYHYMKDYREFFGLVKLLFLALAHLPQQFISLFYMTTNGGSLLKPTNLQMTT